MSGHKLENISLIKVERMMVTYIIEGTFRGVCQRLKEACHGSEGPHDNSRSRKRPDKINSSPGSTNSHGLAELKSLASFFNALRSQPSPGASDELKFAFLSEFSWAALDYSVWRASSPKPKNCLEPPPLVSKPGRETPGSASPAPKFPKTRGFLCLQGVVVKFYCWFWEQLILKLSSGRKWETTAWGWAEET